jgi:hypothetical protein
MTKAHASASGVRYDNDLLTYSGALCLIQKKTPIPRSVDIIDQANAKSGPPCENS